MLTHYIRRIESPITAALTNQHARKRSRTCNRDACREKVRSYIGDRTDQHAARTDRTGSHRATATTVARAKMTGHTRQTSSSFLPVGRLSAAVELRITGPGPRESRRDGVQHISLPPRLIRGRNRTWAPRRHAAQHSSVPTAWLKDREAKKKEQRHPGTARGPRDPLAAAALFIPRSHRLFFFSYGYLLPATARHGWSNLSHARADWQRTHARTYAHDARARAVWV